jgi:hypothetical protein
VNVNVVENSVNSHVGKVIVVNVINQYKIEGTVLNAKRTRCPRVPIMEVDEGVFRVSLLSDVGMIRLKDSGVSRLSTSEDTAVEKDMIPVVKYKSYSQSEDPIVGEPIV